MWQSAAELHAALNDLPAALLVMAVLFEILGSALKRETLRTAGFWMLVAGAVGALAAIVSGLRAEATIEHGNATHMIMERHQTLAITTGIVFGLLAGWRVLRRKQMPSRERSAYLTVAVAGSLLLFYVAHLGGNLVFRYGAGVPTATLRSALSDRSAGHEHAPGETHDHGAAADSAGAAVDSAGAAGQASGDHTHPPGTPPHQH
jgi:uncharacterized membrane protein